jgi:hypothetical protein
LIILSFYPHIPTNPIHAPERNDPGRPGSGMVIATVAMHPVRQ